MNLIYMLQQLETMNLVIFFFKYLFFFNLNKTMIISITIIIVCLLDFGLDVLESLVKKSNFPWILSNVFDAETNKPLVNNTFTKVVVQVGNVKVGVIALAEKDWVVSLASVNFDDILFESYVETANKLINELKNIDV